MGCVRANDARQREESRRFVRERAQKLSSLNADDAMKAYAALAQMHADNTQKLAASFSTLYAALSDDQKKPPMFYSAINKKSTARHASTSTPHLKAT